MRQFVKRNGEKVGLPSGSKTHIDKTCGREQILWTSASRPQARKSSVWIKEPPALCKAKEYPPIRTLDCEWGDYSLIGLFIGLYLKVLKITVGKRSEGKS